MLTVILHWRDTLSGGGQGNAAVSSGRIRRAQYHDYNTRAGRVLHPGHLPQRQ
jgi:hypothetical protein